MNAALVRQAHEIRKQAAQLLLRAETLLEELRQTPDIIAPPNPEEQIAKKNGRIVLHVR